ncbi:hypothetical protein IEU95_15505 [Hoyosella rhizosphaerae]|uniref:Uncharacterized protein n=1 Tax=Hoyosella rhizosphaerae TaxID=1755582 RepID=A0A916UI53_9ACTN|nr:hypothetical protein [Hoyosella rhizosphaerae]MBN4928240.1 hypothetical protein [Hoyosella rhizosphaerae]GGC73474.1 hypothetical protein GCM10011410_28270 [Hoyosella rhizosphaerae]
MPTRYTPAPPLWLLSLVLGALYVGLAALNIAGTGRAGGFIAIVLVAAGIRTAWLYSQGNGGVHRLLELTSIAVWIAVVAAFGHFGINAVGPEVPWSAASFYQGLIAGGVLAMVTFAVTMRRHGAIRRSGSLLSGGQPQAVNSAPEKVFV